jgi:hypothetical protein
VPQKYRQQIAKENWGDMLTKINDLVSSQLKLPTNFDIPFPTIGTFRPFSEDSLLAGNVISSIVTNVTLSTLHDDWLQLKGISS